jgi:hypothetical protein
VTNVGCQTNSSVIVHCQPTFARTSEIHDAARIQPISPFPYVIGMPAARLPARSRPHAASTPNVMPIPASELL